MNKKHQIYLTLEENKIKLDLIFTINNTKINYNDYLNKDYRINKKLKTDYILINDIYTIFDMDIFIKSNNKIFFKSENIFIVTDLFNDNFNFNYDKKLVEINDIIKNPLKQTRNVKDVSKHLKLRDYQNIGSSWMHAFSQLNTGCILADEMGLGKTIQVISLISKIGLKKPVIIISPLSVLSNWKNEIEKFTNFTYEEFTGEYKDSYFLNPNNILLCSYESMRNNIDKLKKVNFKICVFDEGQKLKNYKSNTAIAAHKLSASSKIILSGTPIENNWYELWSLFNIIAPNYLSNNISEFKNNYLEDDGEDNYTAKENLFIKTKQFILGRTKKEVLSELPKIYTEKISSLSKLQKGSTEKYFQIKR